MSPGSVCMMVVGMIFTAASALNWLNPRLAGWSEFAWGIVLQAVESKRLAISWTVWVVSSLCSASIVSAWLRPSWSWRPDRVPFSASGEADLFLLLMAGTQDDGNCRSESKNLLRRAMRKGSRVPVGVGVKYIACISPWYRILKLR